MQVTNNLPGCYNQPRPAEDARYAVLTRQFAANGQYMLKPQWIPRTMSRECHQSGIPECAGCQHECK